MSVDVLQPNCLPGHIFKLPRAQMKEIRAPTHVRVSRSKNDEKSTSHIHVSRRRTEDNCSNINHFDPNCIIYDVETDTTYIRGRLLGKVRI